MNNDSIELVNAVGGGDISIELDLRELSESLELPVNRYDPGHHPSLYIKFNEEGATLLIFRTGKYNIAGADSIDNLLFTNDLLLEELADLGIVSAKIDSNFDIRNLVYTTEFETEFDLSKLTIGLGMENSEYEPEQFPGLQYTPQDEQGLFLIFRTGKVILTGVNNEDVANILFSDLKYRLRELGAI